MTVSTIVSKLRDLLRDRKLIPFVGAGLSMRFGLPSWNALVKTLGEDMGWDPAVFVSQGNALQLAEFYVLKNSIGKLRSLMDKAFVVEDGKIQASRAHAALTKLNVPQVYTTNYDTIIESSFRVHNVDHAVVTNIDGIASARGAAVEIVKFHGSFEDDQSLVLTESSYFERMDFDQALDIKLRADTLGRALLFLGYGFNDVNVRFLLYKLHKLRERGKRNTAAMPTAFMTTLQSNQVQRLVLENWGVETIELDPKDPNASLDEFLEQLT